MEIVGQKVLHKTLGCGVIVWYGGKEQNDKLYILVKYDNTDVEYPFPNVFEKHLKAMDPDFEAMIANELSKTATKKQENPEPTAKNKGSAPPKTHEPQTHKKPLTYGKPCGTNSKNIYLDCCESFGWDKTKQNSFGRQGAKLYSKGATPEGYSPWFISHHNLTQTKGGSWSNTIEGDFIYEKWDNYETDLWNDKTERVVFIKLNAEYYFWGVFGFLEIKRGEDNKYSKVYKRIKRSYPD